MGRQTHQHPPSTVRLMGKWRQLSSLTNISATRLLKASTISTWASCQAQNFEGRGDKVAPEAWPKVWSSKKQSLRIVFAIFCRQQSSTKKNQSRFFTRATPLVATKMVNFVSKRNARYTSVIPFPTILSVFTPTLTVCKAGRRSVVPWRHNQNFSDP